MDKDVRWVQRLDNFSKALLRLRSAVNIVSSRLNFGEEVDELLEEGTIQRFEYTHELAWNTMKDYEEYQGYPDIRGSRDAIRKALEIGLIDDRRWMESIGDRNRSSHSYDDVAASGILLNVIEIYCPLFEAFEKRMKTIYETENL